MIKIAFYLVLILCNLLGIIAFILHFANNRKLMDESFDPSDKKKFDKYITIHLLKKDGSKGHSGGLRHCEYMLADLLMIAQKCKRTLVLPPPSDILTKNHGKIDKKTEWTDYFDVNIITQDMENIDCPKSVYNILKTKFKTIAKDDTYLIVLKLQANKKVNDYDNHPWSQLNPGKINNTWEKPFLLPANKSIINAAKSLVPILKKFATIHVRRGDVIASDTCYGKREAFKHATSIKRIKEISSKFQDYDHLVIFSNENKEYFKELLEQNKGPKYLFEDDLPKELNFKILDNNHSVLFNTEIAKLGEKHICTITPRMEVNCDDFLCIKQKNQSTCLLPS